MDLLFTLLFSFVLLLVSTAHGILVAYPLLIAMILLCLTLMQRGFALKQLMHMAFMGSRQSVAVFSILLLIGVVIATWIAAGTVPAIVYYGILLIHPQFFILSAFVLTSLVSLLIGTSFGAVGTIGLALMIMANGSAADPHMIAGAIIAGAYVGDRCSPMSSSANLIAVITQTDLYRNIRSMWRTAWPALGISMAVFGIISWLNPVQMTDQLFADHISQTFQISWIDLLPAVIILGLSFAQVDVKLSMLISIAMASAIALFYQHYSLGELLKFMVFGFQLDPSYPIHSILSGGGIVSMLRVTLVVIVSTAFAGIFAGTQVLDRVGTLLERARSDRQYFLGTCLVGIGAAAFGCTQTIAILLTKQLVEQTYPQETEGQHQLAIDLENSVVVLSPLIPWNIAGLVPATILMTDAQFIPFAVYLYLLPLCHFIPWRRTDPTNKAP